MFGVNNIDEIYEGINKLVPENYAKSKILPSVKLNALIAYFQSSILPLKDEQLKIEELDKIIKEQKRAAQFPDIDFSDPDIKWKPEYNFDTELEVYSQTELIEVEKKIEKMSEEIIPIIQEIVK